MSAITGRKVALFLTLGAFVFVLFWLAYVTVAASVPVDALAFPTPTGIIAWLTGGSNVNIHLYLPIIVDGSGDEPGPGKATATPTPRASTTPAPTQGPIYGYPTPTPYWASVTPGGPVPTLMSDYWYPVVVHEDIYPNAGGEFWFDYGIGQTRAGCDIPGGMTRLYVTDMTRVGSLVGVDLAYKYDVAGMLNPATCHIELHYVMNESDINLDDIQSQITYIDYTLMELEIRAIPGMKFKFDTETPMIVYGKQAPEVGDVLNFWFKEEYPSEYEVVYTIMYAFDQNYAWDLELQAGPPTPTPMPPPLTPVP